MKKTSYIVAVIISCCLFFQIRAGETNNFDVSSALKDNFYTLTATNGLEMRVDMRGKNYLDTKLPIYLDFRSLKQVGWLHQPNDEYLANLKLVDTNNQIVPKTAIGSHYMLNTNITHWGRQDSDLLRRTKRGLNVVFPVGGDIWESSISFPSIDKLFEIKKPGTYKLRMEVQVFFMLNTSTNAEIIHYLPLEIPVIKSE